MLERFDSLGPFAVFARIATGLTLAGAILLVVGLLVASPVPRGLPPVATMGLLLVGTGGGLIVGGATIYMATGGAVRRSGAPTTEK